MAIVIKICGLTDEASMSAALDVGVDMVGLVFFKKSPRFVDWSRARALAEMARGRSEIVSLTVDGNDALMEDIAHHVRPDWYQMHGSETRDVAANLKDKTGASIMKVIGVRSEDDLDQCQAYAGIADRFLLDAKPPKDASRPGGLGNAFDWSLLKAMDPALPYMLAGGLNEQNVADAIRDTTAMGIDVSSGVESAPGQKAIDLIKSFVEVARAADQAH